MSLPRTRNPVLVCALLGVLTLILALAALAVGAVPISSSHVLASLLQGMSLNTGLQPDAFEVTTVTQIRLPRVVLALLIGGALGQAGAVMQAIFRNPLAEPGLVGISSGAALAAVSIIVLGPGLFSWIPQAYALPLCTFTGAALATVVVTRLALVDGYTRTATLLLAGLALNAITGAGIGLLSHLASDTALRTLTFWMFGSLGKAGWPEIAVAAPLLLIPLILIPRKAQALNALLLGEAEAGHLGVNVEKLKRQLTFLVVLAVGSAVSLAGIIGFVGLMVPHLIRLWAGPDHRLLLPASALLGAALLTFADMAARVCLAPVELPVGILTALIGGPFFIALLIRYRADPESL